jgi:hydroxymethylpyrimidine pyrophosphatase-like HAD family hydrolase
VTYSALGQQAPLEEKKKWDPDKKIRQKIVSYIKDQLPEYEISIGGTTSIDITRKGYNKAYGIRKLLDYLHLKPEEVLFVGDAIFPGGNDWPAVEV